ncbi:SDR family NAD(P)-dependent oxidoreductase [Nocardia sp. CA-135398]|uniref:SDR family NAD(P)-dependent oxidoreductase n=1 Tax=Nocardia sp. CA-135398 TaxID=3239977 RepID=UPI003D9559D4
MEDFNSGWSTVPSAGSRIVVTGAAGGLGRVLTAALEQLHCEVVGIDQPGTSGASNVRMVEADLTDNDAARRAVEQAMSALGGIDAVVGAAAVVDTVHAAATFAMDEFRADIEANLVAQFAVAQAAYPGLTASNSPSIVFVSSLAALDGLPGQVSYAAAKAGLLGMTRTLAAEWLGVGIRVNAVAPGLFATPKVLAMPAGARERLLAGVPMKRLATVGEVVGSVLYLLSPAAGYTTGEVLRLDGGSNLNCSGLYR